jgi:para-nitrobenzyl esterase
VKCVVRLWLFQSVFTVASLAQTHPPIDTPPLVTIDCGTLEGAHFGAAPDEVMFLGIPFAAPPTGALRWKPPQPVAKWQSIRKANAYGAACPQKEYPDLIEAYKKRVVQTLEPYWTFRTDEDCLYLNVWTTNLPANHPPAKKVPVMFWIHGGGNVEGAAQNNPMGPLLARKGVVLVSINYRLGALGFLAHPALTAESPHHASGNYAILDQVAALEWVRRNIARFGGDPTNVTIFGESAGGANVCYLMSSPLARGLFQRGILESNVCNDHTQPELKTPTHYHGGVRTSEDIGMRLMQDLNIPDGPDSLAKLRSKTPKEIMDASDRDPAAHIKATIDGWVLTEQTAITFAQGRQTKVPVIVGSNSDEGTNMVEEIMNGPPTLANYKAFLKNEFLDYSDEVFRMYPAATDAEARAASIAFVTDYNFGSTAHDFARDVARAGQKTWFYYFTYTAKAQPHYIGLGAFHGIEMRFLDGFFPSSWGEPDAEDRKMLELMTGYWTQFAKTGDPNGPGLPPWPVYDPKADLVLEIGHEVRLRPTPHTERFLLFERSLSSMLTSVPESGKAPPGTTPQK